MVGKSLLALLLLPLCAAKQDRQPDDDDRTIWVSNGTGVPGELFVGLLNTGRKGQAHRIEAAGDAAYLDRAAKIFADLAVHAWDDACGGGVWWSYAKSYKNAITNELFFAMAMKLHGAAGPDVVVAGRTYLDWGGRPGPGSSTRASSTARTSSTTV
ncbi:glycosyl hydrolase [Aureococcus anophagefferens]|nr:glycosyl hydrolase [Aureococcus anophagefferens]